MHVSRALATSFFVLVTHQVDVVDVPDVADCIDLFDMKPGHGSLDCAPLDALSRDGFESGGTSAWTTTVP